MEEQKDHLPEELIPKTEGYDEIINCRNPAEITPEFSNCLVSAAKSNHKVMIKVDEKKILPVILHSITTRCIHHLWSTK